jgi:hypothetical protein
MRAERGFWLLQFAQSEEAGQNEGGVTAGAKHNLW